MRFVIIGAGAVGGAMGGRLAERGHPVLLVARGDNHIALHHHGLVLALPGRVITVKPEVVSVDEEVRLTPEDVLLLTVKSQHSEPLIRWAAALRVSDQATAGEELPIVCCQNGLANEPTALRYFAKVHGSSLMLPVTHLEPGHVDAHGWPFTGLVRFGRYPNGTDELDKRLASVFEEAGFATAVEENIMAWKRAKLLLNLGNAVQALCGYELTGEEARVARLLIGEAREEASRCFVGAGLEVAGEDHVGVGLQVRSVAGRPRRGSSTWQSLSRGSGSVETDFLNGEVVRLGRTLGIETPVNELLQLEMRRLQQVPPARREPITAHTLAAKSRLERLN